MNKCTAIELPVDGQAEETPTDLQEEYLDLMVKNEDYLNHALGLATQNPDLLDQCELVDPGTVFGTSVVTGVIILTSL